MPDDLSSVLESPGPKLLSTGYGLSEGPVWHAAGYLTFTDPQRSQLFRWDPASGKTTMIREHTGGSNGATLDRDGRLVLCESNRRRITKMDPVIPAEAGIHVGGKGSGASQSSLPRWSITVLAERWQGKRINRPNDVVRRKRDGSIYFTNPHLLLPMDQRDLGKDFAGVFFITTGGELKLGRGEGEYPNGLAFSPDESLLYVAISFGDERCFGERDRKEVCRHRCIRVFDVAADGSLWHNRVFADMSSAEPGVPDGIKVDTRGRVFCCGSGGIWVLEPSGRLLGIIRMPEIPRNLAFGGADYRTFFVCAGGSLYSLQMKTPGIGCS